MVQIDRYKRGTIAIDFNPSERFTEAVKYDYYQLVLITNGKLKVLLNELHFIISAPSMICLSSNDSLVIEESKQAAIQSFSFKSDFLITTTLVQDNLFIDLPERKQINLELFQTNLTQRKIISLSKELYPNIFQHFFILGTEVFAQSDFLWICRIKKHLIQLTTTLTTIVDDKEDTPVDLALKYIHTNYHRQLTLEDLAKQAHINRVTLNKLFREQCGFTAIAYLILYRLEIAMDLLVHTNMHISGIAEATGFQYDTYFMKKFKQTYRLSPTKYRNAFR